MVIKLITSSWLIDSVGLSSRHTKVKKCFYEDRQDEAMKATSRGGLCLSLLIPKQRPDSGTDITIKVRDVESS